MKAFPIVEVLWVDALEVTADWVEIKDIKNECMPSRSVGYLVKESKKSITIVSLMNNHHVGLGITIPRGMITKIKRL